MCLHFYAAAANRCNKYRFTYGVAAERENRRIRKTCQSRNLKELYTFADKAALLAESIAFAQAKRFCTLRCRWIDAKTHLYPNPFGHRPRKRLKVLRKIFSTDRACSTNRKRIALFFFVPCTARFFFWQRKRNVGCIRTPARAAGEKSLFLSQREKEEGGAKNFVSFSKESNAKTPVFVKRTQIHPLRFVKNRVGKSAQTGLTNTTDYSIL